MPATGTAPARQGVVDNDHFDRPTGKTVPNIRDRVLDKEQSVQVPTIYDAAHKAGLRNHCFLRSARALTFARCGGVSPSSG
jgi:hypothetical protein